MEEEEKKEEMKEEEVEENLSPPAGIFMNFLWSEENLKT